MKSPHIAVFLLAFFALNLFYIANLFAGQVIFWGYGIDGNISPSLYSSGVVVMDGEVLTNAIAIAAGKMHALAIRSDSTVVGWGYNNKGQATGVPTAGPTVGVVKLDGQILSNVVAVAAGVSSSLALKSDGTVVSWGMQMAGNKMHTTVGLSNVVSIADGLFGITVTSDGSVFNTRGDQYKTLSNVVAIAIQTGSGGGNVVRAIALKNDATVIESVLDHDDPPVTVGVSNAVAVSAGGLPKLALKRDGTVFGWNDGSNVPGGLSNVVAISAGSRHSLALKKDGTVTMWGYYRPQALAVPEGLSNVVAVAAGNDFFLAITTNRAVAEKFRH